MTTAKKKPIIAISMGDAAGIGPEIVTKCLKEPGIYEHSRPLVIGDYGIMAQVVEQMKLPLRVHSISSPVEALFTEGTIDCMDTGQLDISQVVPGKLSSKAGRASLEYVIRAVELALDGSIHAILTAPVNKEAINRAGILFSDQTGYIGKLSGVEHTGLVLISGKVHLVYCTGHIPLREACKMITREHVLERIRFTISSLFELGIERPKIVVCALNPHASDGGIFGHEEKEQIIPAIEDAKSEGLDVEGPVTTETVWLRSKEGEFDGVLSMTHDHGNIGIKLIGQGPVFTYQGGLPIIRTSVGHGTAFDIAGTYTADHSVIAAAFDFAVHLALRKMG